MADRVAAVAERGSGGGPADRLVPVCGALLEAASESVGTAAPVEAYTLLEGIGNFSIGAADDARYETDAVVHLLVSGVVACGAR